MNRNWTRATAVVARGDGEEYRGVAVGPFGRRNHAGDHVQRRREVRHEGSSAERERGRARGSWRCVCSPGSSRAWSVMEGNDAGGAMIHGGLGGGREWVGGGDGGPPGTIPSAWGARGARRVPWWCRRELRRPESPAGTTAEASGGGGILARLGLHGGS